MGRIHTAVQAGNTTAVRNLLCNDFVDVNDHSFDHYPPLHIACREGHLVIAKMLIEHGADVNLLYDYDMWDATTCLHIAARRNDLPLATLLLDHGADPFRPTRPTQHTRNTSLATATASSSIDPSLCTPHRSQQQRVTSSSALDAKSCTENVGTASKVSGDGGGEEKTAPLHSARSKEMRALMQRKMRQRWLTFCLGRHQRVGSDSWIQQLPVELIPIILSHVFPFRESTVELPPDVPPTPMPQTPTPRPFYPPLPPPHHHHHHQFMFAQIPPAVYSHHPGYFGHSFPPVWPPHLLGGANFQTAPHIAWFGSANTNHSQNPWGHMDLHSTAPIQTNQWNKSQKRRRADDDCPSNGDTFEWSRTQKAKITNHNQIQNPHPWPSAPIPPPPNSPPPPPPPPPTPLSPPPPPPPEEEPQMPSQPAGNRKLKHHRFQNKVVIDLTDME